MRIQSIVLGTLVRIAIGLALIAAPMALYKLVLAKPLGMALGYGSASPPFLNPMAMLACLLAGYSVYLLAIERRSPAELVPDPGKLTLGAVSAVALIGGPILGLYAAGCYQMVTYRGLDGFLVVIPTILTAAMLEEVVFRGLIFAVLERGIGTIWAMVVQSCLFGLIHMSNPGLNGWIALASIVLIGALWTCLFVLWRNVWAVGAHHAVWNLTIVATGLPLSGLEEFRAAAPFDSVLSGPELMTGGAGGPELSLVTLALVATAIAGLLVPVWSHRRPGMIGAALPSDQRE